MKTMQEVEESIKNSLPAGYCCQPGQRPYAGRGRQSRSADECDRDDREIQQQNASLRFAGFTDDEIDEMDAAGELV